MVPAATVGPSFRPLLTVKVAAVLAERRATARIPYILRQCFGSQSAGRAAIDTSSPTSFLTTTPARRNISDSTHTRPHACDTPPDDSPLFLTGLETSPPLATKHAAGDGASPSQIQQTKTLPFVPASTPRPIMHRRPEREAGIVHILGDDRRAGFLANELRQVYDSVHVLKSVDDRLADFKFEPPNPSGERATIDPRDRQQDQQLLSTTSETPIRNLITTSTAVDTVSAMEQLKSRISDQTTLCLMNDGLGVAEELSETVFNDATGPKPEYLMGRLNRMYLKREKRVDRDCLDRKFSGNTRGFIHVHPDVTAVFSPYDPALSTQPHLQESRLACHFYDELTSLPHLRVECHAYHNWLSTKLQDMIFYSVVDPVATLVGCRYNEVISNGSARHLVVTLVNEIRSVIALMPELKGSRHLNVVANEKRLLQELFARLRMMRPIPPKMLGHLRRGWRTDIDWHNGYFVRRAKQLRVPCPQNEMVISMIKAKCGMYQKEMRTRVPFEITSRLHGEPY